MDTEQGNTRGTSQYEIFVRNARNREEMRDLVQKHYLDDDVEEASQRYASSVEFMAVLPILKRYAAPGFRVLDIGAGRGLTSLALAEQGLNVTALEYDPSDVIGARALARLSQRRRTLPLQALQGDALHLPFRDASFDTVFCRSVLHHLPDLKQGLGEIGRVLKPGGLFLACGEHIRRPFGAGRKFLASHPAVAYGVDERAYPALVYRWLVWRAGLRRARVFGYPLEFADFAAATRRNPVRARLTAFPVLGTALLHVLHAAHIAARRHLFVPEEFLPAISIVAEKRERRNERSA